MSARDNILARIRKNSGREGLTTGLELSQVRTHIARQELGPQPSIARDSPVGRWLQECDGLKSTVEAGVRLAEVPRAAAADW
ncbi:MAG: lactate utilization protein C, partial [Burkholderiales bacterium]